MSCSQRKDPSKELLPAITRYDGPAFRLLRKYLRERPAEAPTVLIVSAAYGLISADREIPVYDCRLSVKAAEDLRPTILTAVSQVLQSQRWEAISICMGKSYREAAAGFLLYVPEGVRLEVIGGGLGKRLTQLHKWLHSIG